jgi:hypothetical protein
MMKSFLLKYECTDMYNIEYAIKKNRMRQILLENCIELTKEKDSRPHPSAKMHLKFKVLGYILDSV